MTSRPFTLVADFDNSMFAHIPAFQAFLRSIGHPAGDLPAPAHYDFVKSGWFESKAEFLDLHTQAVLAGMFRDMDLIPGAADAIDRLRGSGVRVIGATARLLTGHDDIEMEHTWAAVARHKLPIRTIHFTRDKHTIDGDLWVDDSPSVIAALDAHGCDRLVFDQPNNQDVPGARARSWFDVVATVDYMRAYGFRRAAA